MNKVQPILIINFIGLSILLLAMLWLLADISAYDINPVTITGFMFYLFLSFFFLIHVIVEHPYFFIPVKASA